MTKDQLIHKLASLEWEDFEVKAAKSELPKSVLDLIRLKRTGKLIIQPAKGGHWEVVDKRK